MVNVVEQVKAFLESSPDNFAFPTGDGVAIPTPAEASLLSAVSGLCEMPNEVALVRKSFDMKAGYALMTFSARMAIRAVRERDASILWNAVGAMFVASDEVDYRDVLIVLSIINDCTTQLGGDLGKILHPFRACASARRWSTMEDGFLRRPEDLKVPKSFGYVRVEGVGGLDYQWRGG